MNQLMIVIDDIAADELLELREMLLEDPSVDSVRASDPRQSGEGRLDPVTISLVVTGIIVGTGLTTRIADWWRARSDCLLVIDARGPELILQPRCDLPGYRGQKIIVTSESTQVRLTREEGAIGIDQILSAARAGESSLKKLASAAPDAVVAEPLNKQIQTGLDDIS